MDTTPAALKNVPAEFLNRARAFGLHPLHVRVIDAMIGHLNRHRRVPCTEVCLAGAIGCTQRTIKRVMKDIERRLGIRRNVYMAAGGFWRLVYSTRAVSRRDEPCRGRG